MGVWMCGNELRIDQDGSSAGQELLFADLVMDPRYMAELQGEHLEGVKKKLGETGIDLEGWDIFRAEEEPDLTVFNSADLIVRHQKNQVESGNQYRIPLAPNIVESTIPQRFQQLGLNPMDANGHLYR